MRADHAAAVAAALPLAAAAIRIRRRKARVELVAARLQATERRYEPRFRGNNLVAQTCLHPSWALIGPAETGKTWAMLWRLDSLLRQYPNSRASLVRKVRSSMDTTVLETWRKVIAIRGGVNHEGGKKPTAYFYPNGATLFVGGMDDPGKILSAERDWIACNQGEELELADFETMTTRVTGRGAVTENPMIFLDANPGPSTHWIVNTPSLVTLPTRHRDNPSLFDDDGTPTEQWTKPGGTKARLDALSGVRRDRLRDGLWVSAEGIVYEDYDRAVHGPLPRFSVPLHWRWVVGIDFGYNDPFVATLWAIGPDGEMVLVKEVYKTHGTVLDHVPALRRMTKGLFIEAWVADHDREDRETLHQNGIQTIAADKRLKPGLDAVMNRFNRTTIHGVPEMRFLEDTVVERDEELATAHRPTCTTQELEVYAWPKAVSGKPIKEVPIDKDNHGCDTMRYAVMYVDADLIPKRGASAVGKPGTFNVPEERGWGDPLPHQDALAGHVNDAFERDEEDDSEDDFEEGYHG